MERELLHSAIRRALRHMMGDAQDSAAFLADVRGELALVLSGTEQESRALLLAEFEAVLRCLRAEASRSAAPDRSGPGAA